MTEPNDPLDIAPLLRQIEGSAGDPSQKPETMALLNRAAAAIRALAAKLGETNE